MSPSIPPSRLRRLSSKVARKVAGRLSNDPGVQYDWQAWYRRAAARRSPHAVLADHHNAAALRGGFAVGAYMEKNLDVTDRVASAGEAAFHYLEFGLAEERVGTAWAWDPAFVRLFHGQDLPAGLTAVQAAERLLRSGVRHDAMLLTEEHFWLSFGLHGPFFAKIFEHETYAVLAAQRGMPLPKRDRLTCIRHFCETGLEAGIPVHPDHDFDESFYFDALNACEVEAPGPTQSVRRHWAQIGVREGAHGNVGAFLSATTGLRAPPAILAALPAYRDATPTLAKHANMAETANHLIKVAVPGASVFDRSRDDVINFLTDLARYKRAQGDLGEAEWLLWRVLDQQPDNPRANLDLADLIYPQSRTSVEEQLRRRVPPDFDIGANAVTLAERLLDQNEIGRALAVAEGLPKTVFSDVTLRRRRRDIGARAFWALWKDLPPSIARHSVPDLQDLLTRALSVYAPPFTAPVRSGEIRRVAILANDDLYQCKLYRADQKADQLRAQGYHATVYAQSRDIDHLKDHLAEHDAVIFMRVPAFPAIIDLISATAQAGLATFYDADDLIFDTALFPPPLATYSGQITETEHAGIACGVPLFAFAMGLCDYGIASTPTIQAEMRKVVRSGEVFLHRNALGAPHMRAIEAHNPSKNKKLVIFYGSGTKAHKAEFHDILEPAMAAALKARPGKVEIRIVGQFAGFRHLDPEHPDVHLLEPIWDFETYCAEVGKADINLSVLEPSIITDAKSEIKWMEAAMFGIPSIVSPTATHRDVVEDTVTGLLAKDLNGFTKALLYLIDHPERRAEMGAAARERVLRDYGLPAMGANFDAIFEAIRPAAARAKKARLLIVNVFYPPQDIGGATRVVQDNVADILERYGDRFEIDVVATLEGGDEAYKVATYSRDGARIWTVTARPGIENLEAQDHKMGDVFDHLLDRIAPDLVHFHCIQRLTASIVDTARRRNIPYVVSLHDGWWMSPNQFIAAPSGGLETYDFSNPDSRDLPDRARILYRGLRDASAVVAVSRAFADVHKTAGLDFVESLENGVSTLPDVRKLPGPEGRVRVGHVGGAARHKGYALLRAAVTATDYQNIDLVIVDHALPIGQIRHEVWNATPVTVLPRLPLDRVAEIYERIDVLLAPSTWPESYGLVTREALGAGLWVVASDMGAIGQDVIEGENGHIVSVEDHTGLATCLKAIDAAPEKYAQSPTATPRKLRRSREQADELVALYTRLLRECKGP